MIAVRKSNDRGRGEHGWLHSYHSFSFAGYHDPEHMNFRTLRVLNDDTVEPGRGFGTHPHNNMEIFSYVVSGALAHKDSTGTEATVRPGGVQFMSAGSGVTHSEYNHAQEEQTHLLQIWIEPAERDTEPRYEDRDFSEALGTGALVKLLSPDASDGSIRIGQDAVVHGARAREGTEYRHAIPNGRGAWVQVISGGLAVNGVTLAAGDAAAIEDEHELSIVATDDAEFLLFDLA